MRGTCVLLLSAAPNGCRRYRTLQRWKKREWRDLSITWFAVVAPPGTPATLTGAINKAISEMLGLPDVRDRFAQMGVQPMGGSVADTKKFIADERSLWRDVIRATNIKVE
jgi:tripartite-type tricarboxylate transporter receptor subunit TctC